MSDYKFQQLLSLEKKGKVYSMTGPMSPFMAAQSLIKEKLAPNMHALVRLWNPQCHSGYDHLFIRVHYNDPEKRTDRDYDMYFGFIDMGSSLTLIALYDSSSPDDIVMSDGYKNLLDLKTIEHHRKDTELYDKSENPYIVWTKKEWTEMFKAMHKEDFWASGTKYNEEGKRVPAPELLTKTLN